MSLRKPKQILKGFIVRIFHRLLLWERQDMVDQTRARWHLPESVDIHHTVDLCGNVAIGEYTYINEGSRIASGELGNVSIGRYCEIGRYVHIMAYTHALERPTADEDHEHQVVESNIKIGNYVWIGDKAFIREGVSIEDFAIIGANSVVTRDVEKFEVVGGVPAQHIRFNSTHHKFRR